MVYSTFAALALATDPASPDSLKRKPDSKTADLISVDMWKMIVGQSIFQLIAVLVLNFAGKQILNQGHSTNQAILVQEDHELKTLVFNTFVFCQIFNQLNARVLDRKLNIFSRFWKNYYFLTIMAIMIGGQVCFLHSPESVYTLLTLLRLADLDHLCRWCGLPSRRNHWARLGHFDRRRRALAPHRRAHPTHPNRADRGKALQMEALPGPERVAEAELRGRRP